MSTKLETNNRDKYLVSLLHSLGISSNLNGYEYIKVAIALRLDHHNKSTVGIYREIANIYEVRPSNVERAIRYAVETGFIRGNHELIESLFGYSFDESKGKATNSEFIATIAEHIRMET